MRILVTGATGLLGKHVLRHFLQEGHEVYALARRPQQVTELPTHQVFTWSHTAPVPPQALENMDAVIHLVGENIAAGRWSEKRKQSLRESRILSTKNLVVSVAKLPAAKRPRFLFSASAIGLYGETGEDTAHEKSPAGSGFLPDLCKDWESEARQATDLGMRLVIGRFGVILSKEGGALPKMGPAVLGSGKQWMSWIHIDDVVRFIDWSLKTKGTKGAYNVVTPEPVRNSDFTKTLGRVLKYSFVLPVPGAIIKAALGEMSEIVLGSQKIAPERLIQSDFKFLYPTLKQALEQIFRNDSFLDNYYIANQFVPQKPREVFPFFSQAENLETLTPPWLQFKINRKSTSEVQQDTIIEYKLKIRGVPVKWRTLIKDWQPGKYFVDDQQKGPYTKWTHLHLFEEVPGGTLLRDEVTFRVPGGILGRFLLVPIIRRDVNMIFSYRQKRVHEIFDVSKTESR